MTCIERCGAVSRMVVAGGSALVLGCAGAPAATDRPYAQVVLEEIVRRHDDLIGMELAGTRGEGCVTIAAKDPGDVGDRCDGKERAALATGEPFVEEPTRSDPAFIVTERLHDAGGAVVGLMIADLRLPGGASRDRALERAAAIRSELESMIPSAERFVGGNAAAFVPAAAVVYAPHLDPRSFAASVTNPYLPLIPGTVYRFRTVGGDAEETNVVTVTDARRTILGIEATVVHDEVFVSGQLTEDTYDWYAQDADGTVWYLGEDTKELRNGVVTTTEGSWEAGKGGAQPGIAMWGDPAAHVGEPYRQEYLAGEAEDMGAVISLESSVAVTSGTFPDCVLTEDSTPLEPQVRERKHYCRSVGLVKVLEGPAEVTELVGVERR